jgi:hypothetical protein
MSLPLLVPGAVFVEELIDAHLVKSSPALYGNQYFIFPVFEIPALDSTSARLIHSTPSHTLRLRLFLTLSSHLCLGLSSRLWLFTSGFPFKILCALLSRLFDHPHILKDARLLVVDFVQFRVWNKTLSNLFPLNICKDEITSYQVTFNWLHHVYPLSGVSMTIHFSGACYTQETEVRHASSLISRMEETAVSVSPPLRRWEFKFRCVNTPAGADNGGECVSLRFCRSAAQNLLLNRGYKLSEQFASLIVMVRKRLFLLEEQTLDLYLF